MVDIRKLRSQMALMGYNQKKLVAEMRERGVKISENTLSSMMNGRTSFDCDTADVMCDILKVETPTEKAAIFLA